MCEPRSCQNGDLASGLDGSIEYTNRLGIREEFGVDFVHSSEVVHVGKEDINLDRLGKA